MDEKKQFKLDEPSAPLSEQLEYRLQAYPAVHRERVFQEMGRLGYRYAGYDNMGAIFVRSARPVPPPVPEPAPPPVSRPASKTRK